MKKKIEYQKLFDALEHDGCPICKAVDGNIHRYLEALLYENVTDQKIRLEIRDANGLCHAHAWKLRSHGDPLAHAFIYGSLIKSLSNELKLHLKKNSNTVIFSIKNRFNTLKKCLRPVVDCPVCVHANESERHYIISFVEFANKDREFMQKCREGGLLCIAHTRCMLDICGDTKEVNRVLELQHEKLIALSGNLDEIIRKSDYRFTNEEWTPNEKTAWTKAVRFWSGEKE